LEQVLGAFPLGGALGYEGGHGQGVVHLLKQVQGDRGERLALALGQVPARLVPIGQQGHHDEHSHHQQHRGQGASTVNYLSFIESVQWVHFYALQRRDSSCLLVRKRKKKMKLAQ